MTRQLKLEPAFPDCTRTLCEDKGLNRILSSHLYRGKPCRHIRNHILFQSLTHIRRPDILLKHLAHNSRKFPKLGLNFPRQAGLINEYHGKEARNDYSTYGLYLCRPLEGGGVNSAEFGAIS